MTTNPVTTSLGLSGTRRPGPTRTVIALVLGAVLPAIAGIVLLGSVALRRPLLDRWVPPAKAGSLTVLWGVGLVIAGVLQGVGAFIAGMSITDPDGFGMRTLVGVGAEAVLLFIGRWWLR